MSGEENTVNSGGNQEQKPKRRAPNLHNIKRFDCLNGRVAVVRCAGESTQARIDAAAGGSGNSMRLYLVKCAQWGITDLEGDWGRGPDGKKWKKEQTALGEVYPESIIDTIDPETAGEIAMFVVTGAQLGDEDVKP
jgi:hypothetical protein